MVFIKDLGFLYSDMEKKGVLFLVVDINIFYKKLFYYGEIVVVYIWIEEYNGFKMIYGYYIYNLVGVFFIEVILFYICVDKESFKFIQFCKVFFDWYEVYEKVKKQGSE